jgi:RNA polymerase sigma-70 factor (ECF subfamily)
VEPLEGRQAPATLAVNSADDTANPANPDLSLREAISLDNSLTPPANPSPRIPDQINGTLHGGGADTIRFDPVGVAGPIVLGGTPRELSTPAVTPPVTRGGDGVTVDGNGASGVVRQAQAEDPLAWQRLVALCYPLVGYWARRAGLQPHDRDDLCQEVFRSVARRLAGFRPDGDGGGFRGWLWTITRNKLRDFFRLRRRQFLPPGGDGGRLLDLADRPPEPEDPGPGAADPVVRRALEVLHTEFEERTRLAFWRSAVEEQPAADVGAGLAMSATAVRQARSRVLRRLRQELGAAGSGF